jgi:restriction endonuclease Mrr
MTNESEITKRAQEAAYDRMLDMLLPKNRLEDENDSLWRSTREKLRNQLVIGRLDERFVELEIAVPSENNTEEVAEDFKFDEVMSNKVREAIQSLSSKLGDMQLEQELSHLLEREYISQVQAKRYKRQRFTVKDAVDLLREEEYVKLKVTTTKIDYDSSLSLPQEKLIIIQDSLLELMRRNPDLMYKISHRQFEELIYELFEELGYAVELTSPTRDGGCDLVAFTEDKIGIRTKYIIEAKHYKPENRVGVSFVRQLSAVRQKFGAHHGILITSSSFTKDAIKENKEFYGLHLKDYDVLLKWIKGAC